MNAMEMVVAIVAIGTVASVVRALLGIPRSRRAERFMGRAPHLMGQPDPEADRLRDEVRSLKERVAVLERVITDQSSSASALDREFEKLKHGE